MRILVVGGGGREHAIAWKLSQSPRCDALFATRPNYGLAQLATPVDIASDDVDALVAWATGQRIDLAVIGPEAPLTAGVVDAFQAAGLRAFGPCAAAAELEGSKAFAKHVMIEAGVPTAAYGVFSDPDQAKRWTRELGKGVAVKADGLAAGKGVLLCDTLEEAEAAIDYVLVDAAFGAAGARVVVEELLFGEEASFIAICDGSTVLPLASSQDHKRIGDGDTGPNTGGMGAYSPAPVVTEALTAELMRTVMQPTVDAMAAAGKPFVGFLYAGIMVTADGPKVLEFNVRLGDPETQPLLMRLRSDLVDVFEATLDGRLSDVELSWDPRPALCVVLASDGYPTKAVKGDVIRGLEAAATVEDAVVFHAGTAGGPEGPVTSGGRVLGVTALGADLQMARDRAYEAADHIAWRGQQRRDDIGWRALSRDGQA